MHPLDAQHSQHQKPMETRAVKEHSRQVKKWMDSFRAKYPRHSTNLSIEGWPDGNMASLLDLSKLNASQSGQKQWDLLSSKSSEILGTPRTASISLASQRYIVDLAKVLKALTEVHRLGPRWTYSTLEILLIV